MRLKSFKKDLVEKYLEGLNEELRLLVEYFLFSENIKSCLVAFFFQRSIGNRLPGDGILYYALGNSKKFLLLIKGTRKIQTF